MAVPCPCCQQPVAVPTLEIVIDHYRVSEFEARILRPIWKANGRPVPTERIFDSMFADDPDGGPSQHKMYESLKFGFLRLRRRLAGSGISIENVGYRRGFRLSMAGAVNPVSS